MRIVRQWLTFHDRHEQKSLQGHGCVGQSEREGLDRVVKRYVLIRRQTDLVGVDRGFIMANYISRFRKGIGICYMYMLYVISY